MSRTRDPEEYADRIQEVIVTCLYCQPYDGEYVWVRGSRIWLEDLFDNFGVPQRLRDEVAGHLRCPSCGHGGMDRSEDVGTKFEYEYAHEELIRRAEKKYGDRLADFSVLLREYPYLGAKHPVGRAILKQIRAFPRWTIKDEIWFRARGVQGGTRLAIADLMPPDPQKVPVPEGRYNHAGYAYWYLASTDYAAAAEVVGPGERMAWVQQFRIAELDNLLDLRAWTADDGRGYTEAGEPREVPLLAVGMIFSEVLGERPARDAPWKPEYLVPRFIADAAKNQGYRGIIFKSPRHFDDNLVVFDRTLPFEPLGEPAVYTLPERFEEQAEGMFFFGGFPTSFWVPGPSYRVPPGSE